MTEQKLIQVSPSKLRQAQNKFGEIVKTFPPLLQNYTYFFHFLGCTPTNMHDPYLTPNGANKLDVILGPNANTFIRTWAIQRVEPLLPPLDEETDERSTDN